MPEQEGRGQNVDLQGHSEQRNFTWQQVQILLGHDLMGKSLAQDLTQMPELKDELSRLVHNPSLGYEGVLRNIFFESGRDVRALITSPFVRAFEATPQCSDEERAFLVRLKSLTTRTDIDDIPEELARDFQEWADVRIPFLAKGLQRCILDSGVIEPLSPKEASNKRFAASKVWREANPSRAAEIQQLATDAAVEAAHPIVFTDEVRAKIQAWFDRGLDYETVQELLKGIGVNTTTASLIVAVGSYEDLHYTLEERRRREREGYREAVKDIFEATGSRSKTTEILKKLGHHPGKTAGAFHQLGLRERINWKSTVEIDGVQRKLEEVMLDFIVSGYPMIKDEHQAFTSFLKEKGVSINISYGAYGSMRSYILNAPQSQK